MTRCSEPLNIKYKFTASGGLLLLDFYCETARHFSSDTRKIYQTISSLHEFTRRCLTLL